MAKQLLHALGYPSVVDLNTIIETTAIQDNLLTKSNLKLMEHVFKPDIHTIKGKTTRQCPHQLVSNVVSIPHKLHDAQHNVCLYIDIMYIHGMPFLTTISKNIKYCTAICSMPLLSYVLTHDEATLSNTVHSHALDCLFLCTVQTKQGGYECYHIPTCQVITQPYVTVIPATPTIFATIGALGKSDCIQNLKVTNLHGHLYLIPLWTLVCLQEWMMQMMRTLLLQECITKTLPCRTACTQHHCHHCNKYR